MADSILLDPLGRRIVLHDHTWNGHIVKGHPEVDRERDVVEQAVRAPAEIRHSKSDGDCRLYYSKNVRADGTFVVVVANVVVGFVKTAYAATEVKGTVEWSS